MRRKDREITGIDELLDIVKKCKVCRIGLSENNIPYVIPLNYGYDFNEDVLTLFFHSAIEGKKLDIIKNNNNACFEIDCDTQLIEGGNACNYGYAFKSIIGFGKIIIQETPDAKSYGLNMIMKHQTEKEITFNFTADQLQNVCVYTMIVDTFTGKQKEYPHEKTIEN